MVLVCSDDGYVLLLERRKPLGLWQSVTGSLEWGETAAHAAQRELYEETGLRLGSRLECLCQRERFRIVAPWKARYAPHARFNTEHWFLARVSSRRLVRVNDSEHRRYRWVRPREAASRVFSWSNRQAIRRYCGSG